MNIAGKNIPTWGVVAGTGVFAAGAIYLYKKHSGSSASSTATTAANTVTDPSTGQTYSATAVDPLTGQTYAAEIAAYGSVSAAESASAGSQASQYNYAGGGAYTNGVGGTNVPQPGAFTSNAQWAQQAESDLVASGAYQSADVLKAIGAFLAKQPLTSAEATIVQAAMAIEGQPPVGGPWSIISQTPTPSNGGGTPAKFPAPTGLHAHNITSTSAWVTWNPVKGADAYQYNLFQMNGKQVISNHGAAQAYTQVTGLHPGWTYKFMVWVPGNSKPAYVTFTTQK